MLSRAKPATNGTWQARGGSEHPKFRGCRAFIGYVPSGKIASLHPRPHHLRLFIAHRLDLLKDEEVDLGGHFADGWGFEEGSQGEVDLEGVLDARDDLRREQGVAPEDEEVVVDADLRAA